MAKNKRSGGITWDKIRQSNYGIDHKLMRMIMKEHIPSNLVLLILYWKAFLPGFSSMRLGYFQFFIYPDFGLHEYLHRAGFDSFMIIKAMSIMIDLPHRDDSQLEDYVVDKLQTDEQILQQS
ncbi:hypothetical protein K432DRAFT_410834 [Lepidopterella palustris CBS 459.81]|uniref:Uncharacterized protein n=1 Tax=Lepidopterella palustris CBS 459.81 TaxID=1314670 RepID=A0A8E2DWX3_9PEZI|nr:hypothetical protein K432DRAFT_410834 [Lepidopterella palustris CBS 459.81]